MKTSILVFILAMAAVAPVSGARASDRFKIDCSGENNNDSDMTLEFEAKIDVLPKASRAGSNSKQARFRVSKMKFYENAKSLPNGPVLTLEPVSYISGYEARLGDQNENGLPDSIVRTFEFSFEQGGRTYNGFATNNGQGGKSLYALHITSTAPLSSSGKTSAWTYCELKRRW